MDTRYHVQITQDVLSHWFDRQNLRVIIRANLAQDRPHILLKHPEVHFDDSAFAAGLRYIEQQRRLAVEAIVHRQDRLTALQAFGRLLHSRQDFYAHSNWVRLWVEQHGGLDACSPDQVEVCLDPLSVPGLISGTGNLWRYLVYHTPIIGPLVKRLYLPPDSHEVMNLDGPHRGPLFPFAVVAATKHSRLELEQLLGELAVAGGNSAVTYLVGQPPNSPSARENGN